MRDSVTDAKGQLTELVRVLDAVSRRRLLEAARMFGSARAVAGSRAARSQDFLYGDDGLPE